MPGHGEASADAAIEGLGVFYLGRRVAESSPGDDRQGEPVLLDSRRLTTHAVCVGMTGSGKTGLLVGLVEEAALDGIPTVLVDPKGDLANVLLSFPSLDARDFLPWVEPEAAVRAGVDRETFAAREASKWSKGLAESLQSADRIARLRAAVEMTVYTPGSRAGRPLAMLESLEAPPATVMADPELRRERIESLVSGILALAGIEAEPARSREHVLLATIVDALWQSGQQVDFGTLVRAIPTPPVDRVGFLDLENFFPAGERFQLATRLNTVAASPGFESWLDGDPLDFGRLLWTADGRPRVSVISIAHLPDSQRMAFVTLLAGQAIAWMRSQPGTSSLKAIFLMDEVFGYLPPTANPPSKPPILTLLKQARAFGLGVVLATQNPVDLDYKGLSNAGTWFLGRLQTARDKARVLDGLEGAASGAGRSFDRGRLDRILSGLGQRTFLLHSVHDDEETVFRTRWTMAYLRGPLTRDEIRRLTGEQPPRAEAQRPADSAGFTAAAGPRPILPPGVREVFLAPQDPAGTASMLHYRPAVLARARVRYGRAGTRYDFDREVVLMAPAGDALGESAWDASRLFAEPPAIEPAPRPGSFGSLPPALAGPKGYTSLAASLKGWLGRTSSLTVWRAPSIDEVSRPGESQAEFRVRIGQRLREARDAELDRVGQRHAAKLSALEGRIERARQKLEKEKAEAKDHSLQTYVSIGSAVLSALLGRSRMSSTTIGKAATSMRSASRSARQQADVAQAEESLSTLTAAREALEAEIAADLERVRLETAPDRVALEEVVVPAKKSDIAVEEVVLAWVPR
jgi:hypothetical protein